jgi:alcohol dehydrogenase class IV
LFDLFNFIIRPPGVSSALCVRFSKHMGLMNCDFYAPTEVQFGTGLIASLPGLIRKLGGASVLLVGDEGIVKAGLMGRVSLVLAQAGIRTLEFTAIENDPSVQSVENGLAFARSHDCDLVVGLGGGSVIDSAKAIAMMLTHGGDIRSFFGLDKFTESGRPLIAIPTTAGTGSEVTMWSVLSDTENHAKVNMGSRLGFARYALLDPELSTSLPPHITAATGMDALTHAVESYVNKAANPFTQSVAERALSLIADNLRLAVMQGENLEARGNMLIASCLAGMSFNRIRLGLAHAFALPLGNRFGIPHGLVNAMMLPAVMRFNVPGNLHGYARIAELFGEPAAGRLRDRADSSVDAVVQLMKDIGLKQGLQDFGVEEQHFDAVVDEAMQSGNVPVNPRAPTRADMCELLQSSMRSMA